RRPSRRSGPGTCARAAPSTHTSASRVAEDPRTERDMETSMSGRRSGVSAVADARGVLPRLGPAARRRIGGAGRLGVDWTMAGLSAVFVGGLFLDGWAHTHGRVDQSFFTPWHAVFYSGYAAVAAALAGAVLARRARGHRWRHAAPAGYGLSLVGGLVFAAAG